MCLFLLFVHMTPILLYYPQAPQQYHSELTQIETQALYGSQGVVLQLPTRLSWTLLTTLPHVVWHDLMTRRDKQLRVPTY